VFRLVRTVVGNVQTRETFEGFGEIGEAYLGGKPRQKNGASSEKTKRRCRTNTTPVIVV
jgi:hypothetical protein